MTDPNTLENVVKGGYCVGCGACAFSTKTTMKINDYGEYSPDLESIKPLSPEEQEKARFVCPSLNPAYNEDRLADEFLRTENDHQSEYIGYYQHVYGGFVKEDNYRKHGTSGGFGTWIGAELYNRGLINGVIHVKETPRNSATDPFFRYGISKNLDEIKKGAKTKYHAIELSEVLHLVTGNPGKYLLIGLPCMIKAVRRIQIRNQLIRESIPYTAALICGHLKSINWTLSLAWAKGISPEKATTFKYRTKGPSIPARSYVFTAYSNTSEIMEDSAKVVGGKFNQGALMLNACNFCDDVVGETADITIGDAWLPRFEIDSQGTNLLIVRNTTINQVLKDSFANNRVFIVELTETEAKDAQSGGYRQRREGLSFRLYQMIRQNRWYPQKRIEANSFTISPLRQIIYFIRFKVTIQSREDFKKALTSANYSYYRRRMTSILKILRFLELASSITRIIRKKIASLKFK